SGKPPSGWSATASSGSRASTGSISICANYSGRKRSMAAGNSVSAPERTLVTTRIYDAPREAVYKAWIDPKQLARWFPPEGFTSPRCEIDARPGGVFRVDMKAPAGPPDGSRHQRVRPHAHAHSRVRGPARPRVDGPDRPEPHHQVDVRERLGVTLREGGRAPGWLVQHRHAAGGPQRERL